MSDSPFLPNTHIQFAWDSTSLGWLKTCPRLYQYSMIEGWRSKGDSVHLKFGQLYHSGLEYYDKLRAQGKLALWDGEEQVPLDHEEALRIVVQTALIDTWEYAEQDGILPKGGKPWSPDHAAKNRETLIRSIIWYLDHFKDDPAQTVVLANGKPAVELSFRMELDYSPQWVTQHPEEKFPSVPYVLCGHLDRVVDFAGGTYVMDRKTTGTTPGSSYFDQYSPDNQMSLYSLAAKVIYQTPVKGVIIDAVQVAVGFSRFARGFTHRSESQLEEWLTNTKTWLYSAEQYATEGFWPMNDKACHHYGGCVFRQVCSKSPEVREKFLESDFERRPWNPLAVR